MNHLDHHHHHGSSRFLPFLLWCWLCPLALPCLLMLTAHGLKLLVLPQLWRAIELVEVVPTAVFVEPRGELAGGSGETGLISQALRPRKLTVKEPRRTTELRIRSSRWNWLARPWRTQGRRVQQSSSSNKSMPSRERPRSQTKGPPTRRCPKSSPFVGDVSSWSSTLQGPRMKSRTSAKKAAEALVEAENAKSDLSNFSGTGQSRR